MTARIRPWQALVAILLGLVQVPPLILLYQMAVTMFRFRAHEEITLGLVAQFCALSVIALGLIGLGFTASALMLRDALTNPSETDVLAWALQRRRLWRVLGVWTLIWTGICGCSMPFVAESLVRFLEGMNHP